MCVFSAELIIRVPLCVWFLQTQSPEEERELWCSQAVVVAFSEVVRSDPADPDVWHVSAQLSPATALLFNASLCSVPRFSGWKGFRG